MSSMAKRIEFGREAFQQAPRGRKLREFFHAAVRIRQPNVENREQRITPEEYFNSFRKWLIEDMPTINGAILKGQQEPEILHGTIQNFVDTVPSLDKLNQEEKKQVIQFLGFAISSLERHTQDQGAKPGEAFATLKGAEPLLIELGKQTGHPPRDSLYTFGLWNRAPNSITFSGDPQEELFIDVINNSIDNLEIAGDSIRPIARGQIAIDNPRAIDAITEASHNIDLARQQFLRYLAKDPQTGQPAFTPAFFRDVMRQYNCNWTIDGEMWGPPTAANAVDQFQLDFIMGTVNPQYEAHLRERFKYFTAADQEDLSRDMKGQSILGVIRDTLHVTGSQLETMSQEEVAQLLRKQPEQTRQFIGQFVKLADKIGTLTALHWTLISNYLIKPNREEEAQRRGAVDNTKGGSGMEFPELQEIRDMRRIYPQVENLSKGLQAL